ALHLLRHHRSFYLRHHHHQRLLNILKHHRSNVHHRRRLLKILRCPRFSTTATISSLPSNTTGPTSTTAKGSSEPSGATGPTTTKGSSISSSSTGFSTTTTISSIFSNTTGPSSTTTKASPISSSTKGPTSSTAKGSSGSFKLQDPYDHETHQPYQPLGPQELHQPQEPKGLHQPYQPQQPHQPTSPQASSIYQPSASKEPSFQSCEVAVSQRVPCRGADISAAACEAISCCFDGQQCYFGKAVTVQYTKDAQFIVVVPVTACGSVVMEEPGVLSIRTRCLLHMKLRLGILEPLPGTATMNRGGLGLPDLRLYYVSFEMAKLAKHWNKDNQLDECGLQLFLQPTDYPVTKVLRDPVYVEVQLIEKTDPKLILTLGRCWTTASPNTHSLPQWDILIDRCPYRDDHYLSSLVPVSPSSGLDFPGHYRRFMFKMFTFVNPSSIKPMKEQVYIHCSTAVCSALSGRNCEPSCFRKKRDVRAADKKTAEP
ncbi:hypothetical protein L3Q82_024033, partial [Scortum barcoo]